MNRKLIAIVFILLAVIGVSGATAFAQQPPATTAPRLKPGGPTGDQLPPPNPADIQAWFDAMVVVQAQRALGLSDSQYPQFVGKLKALQDVRRRNQRARNQLIQEIARLTNPSASAPDEGQLRDKLKALDELQGRAAADVRKAYEQLDQVLDLRQQARFRVFEEQIERRKFEILLNARRRAAGRGTEQ